MGPQHKTEGTEGTSENAEPQYKLNSCQNCDHLKKEYESKFEQLTDSINHLKNIIETLIASNTQQNAAIMGALATQKVITEKLLGRDKLEISTKNDFPIKTIAHLAEINNKITEKNRPIYVDGMAALLKGNLNKSLTQILSVEVIIASNVNGIHGKVSLKEYRRFFDILMDAIQENGELEPETAVKNALKVIKKRHFQAVCINKKKKKKKPMTMSAPPKKSALKFKFNI